MEEKARQLISAAADGPSAPPLDRVVEGPLLFAPTVALGSFTLIGTKALADGYALLSSRSADSLRCPRPATTSHCASSPKAAAHRASQAMSGKTVVDLVDA